MADSAEIKDLIQQSRQGNKEALGNLLNLYAGRCYGYFYRLSANRDVSDELLSELFLRLVEKIKTYKTGSFDNWLFTVASNLFKDYLRKQYRTQRLIDEKSKLLEFEKQQEKEDPEISDHLQKALKLLDPDTAELIMLRFYGDLSFKELAHMRDEPIGTTLSKVHRGLKKLKEEMKKLDI